MDLPLILDRSRRVPLAIQIAHAIREAIWTQRVPAGTQLPSTRDLAQQLHVSRMIVVAAYEWLMVEGYVESRPGSGTYVPHTLLLPPGAPSHVPEPPRRTDRLLDIPVDIDFRPGLPALDLFPRVIWKETLGHACMEASMEQLGYGPVEGMPRLRRAIAQYIARTRGLRVEPGRVVITQGTAQALDLLLRTLAPINAIAIEDPCTKPVQRLLELYHIQPIAIPVDEHGLCVDLLRAAPQAPRVVHVIPSHQYPTGVTMRLDRRSELLTWAQQRDAIILEDDYDSEFRFDQAPPVALAALDPNGRVVYIGSFSKTMFPGLRLGFCVVPESLIDPMLELKWFSDRCPPIMAQLALTEWLETGLFERHVRRMRRVYAQRRMTLLQSLADQFGNRVAVQGVPAGVHVLLSFDVDVPEAEVVDCALQAGVRVYPASPCYLQRSPNRASVILGFGHLPEDVIVQGIERLAHALRKCIRSSP